MNDAFGWLTLCVNPFFPRSRLFFELVYAVSSNGVDLCTNCLRLSFGKGWVRFGCTCCRASFVIAVVGCYLSAST